MDKFVGVQRLKEEQDLLIREMINFMVYYRDIVLNKLEAQHREIKEKIGKKQWCILHFYRPSIRLLLKLALSTAQSLCLCFFYHFFMYVQKIR